MNTESTTITITTAAHHAATNAAARTNIEGHTTPQETTVLPQQYAPTEAAGLQPQHHPESDEPKFSESEVYGMLGELAREIIQKASIITPTSDYLDVVNEITGDRERTIYAWITNPCQAPLQPDPPMMPKYERGFTITEIKPIVANFLRAVTEDAPRTISDPAQFMALAEDIVQLNATSIRRWMTTQGK